jgi:hypothetical protein
MSDEGRQTMREHVGYWTTLAKSGRALDFGSVADPAGTWGVGVALAEDLNDAERLRDGDPAMGSPHGFRTEILPMFQLVTPEGNH